MLRAEDSFFQSDNFPVLGGGLRLFTLGLQGVSQGRTCRQGIGMFGTHRFFLETNKDPVVGFSLGKLALAHQHLIEPETAHQRIRMFRPKDAFFEPDDIAQV
jgi:hypothetical protein